MVALQKKEIYHDANISIVVVTAPEFSQHKTAFGYWMSGNITPLAVIVNAGNQHYVYDLNGELMMPERLEQEMPELAALLD